MKILTFWAIVVLSFLNQSVSAFNYKNGDTLNVFSVNGLNIRDSIGKKGTILATVDFRGQVIVISTFNFANNFSDSINGLKGNWIKVKSGKITGYAFDGFLSSLPVPEIHEYSCVGLENPLSVILKLSDDYCTENLKQVSIYKYEDFRADENIHSFDIITFKNGVQLVKHYYWKWQTNELILNNRRESEVINLSKMLAVFLDQNCFENNTLKQPLYNDDDLPGTYRVLDWEGNMAFYVIKGGPKNTDYRLYFNYWF